MTQWLQDHEGIPIDQHRLCVFVTEKPRVPETLVLALVSTGVKVSFLAILDSDSVTPPRTAYSCYIEPKTIGVTPADLKARLMTPALLVARDAVPAALEFAYDYADLFMQEETEKPYVKAGDDEKLAARLWFGGVGGWIPAAPSDDELVSRLEKSGMKGLVSEGMPQFADPRLKSFMVYTGEAARTPYGIQQALGASAVDINRYPVEADREALLDLAEGGIGENLAETAWQVRDAVRSAADAMGDVADFSKTLFKGLKYALWGGLGIVVAYGGYRAYKHLRGVS